MLAIRYLCAARTYSNVIHKCFSRCIATESGSDQSANSSPSHAKKVKKRHTLSLSSLGQDSSQVSKQLVLYSRWWPHVGNESCGYQTARNVCVIQTIFMRGPIISHKCTWHYHCLGLYSRPVQIPIEIAVFDRVNRIMFS